MTFGDFKKTHKGGYMKCAADDIAGFARKGGSLYGNCDDMMRGTLGCIRPIGTRTLTEWQ